MRFGHLKGVYVKQKKSKPVDFQNQQGVYVLYDASFNLVYVGQAGGGERRLFERLKNHNDTGPLVDRWSRFSWFGLRRVIKGGGNRILGAETVGAGPKHAKILDHVEAVLIAIGEPPHNRQGGRFGDEVEQYRQYDDLENLAPTPDKMMEEVWKKIQNMEKTVDEIWEHTPDLK